MDLNHFPIPRPSPWIRTGHTLAFVAALVMAPLALAQSRFDHLAEFTERGMALWHVPGMAVAVVSSDAVTFSQGFGRTAIVDGKVVDQHTLFAIASTTKAMVVSGLLMLVDDGKLSLDDPIIRHIPELHFAPPLDGVSLRVRDLLAHRTGLPSTDFWSFFQDMPLEEQITRLKSVPQEAPVRSRLIYQNTMFDIAGLLIERLSGQRWDLFLQQRLWRPIGMNETFGARGQIPAEHAHAMPHYYADDQLVLADWDWPADRAQAAGSVWSSTHDMSLWAQFLLRDGVTASGQRLISEAGFAEMFEPQQLAKVGDFYPTVELTRPHWRTYALGWFQQDFQGRRIDFHTGSLNGLIAIIGLDQASDRAVVVLGNRDHAEMRHAILWEVMDDSPPAERRDWNQDIFDLYTERASETAAKWQETERKRLKDTRPALPLTAYTGTYRSPVNGDVVLEISGDNLVFKTALISLPMHHWQLDTFLVEYVPWDLREFASFRIGNEGNVTSLDMFGGEFKRVESAE